MNQALRACVLHVFDAGQRNGSPTASGTGGERFACMLKRWWVGVRMDRDTAFLSMAIDHADLERRIRALDERDRRGRNTMY